MKVDETSISQTCCSCFSYLRCHFKTICYRLEIFLPYERKWKEWLFAWTSTTVCLLRTVIYKHYFVNKLWNKLLFCRFFFLVARLPSPRAYPRLSRQASCRTAGVKREVEGGGRGCIASKHVARVLVILQWSKYWQLTNNTMNQLFDVITSSNTWALFTIDLTVSHVFNIAIQNA